MSTLSPVIGDHVRMVRPSGRLVTGQEGWIVGLHPADRLFPAGCACVCIGREIWQVSIDACEIRDPDALIAAIDYAPEWCADQYRIAQCAALDFAGVPHAWRP